MSLLNKILGRIEYLFACNKFNIGKTFWVNFRSLPFNQAVKFPIYVYGGLRILSLRGKIVINSPIKRGMILLGGATDSHMKTAQNSVLYNISQITFNGSACLCNGFRLQTSNRGTIVLGDDCFFNVNVTVIAGDNITIGDYSRIAFGVTMLNGDIHYVANMTKRKVAANHAPIIIGANNWVTSDVKVMKGCVTPDWTIVLSGSLINKDYTKTIPENSIIGGQPAKLVAEGMRRVFSIKTESELEKYFKNSAGKTFDIPQDRNFDEFCAR